MKEGGNRADWEALRAEYVAGGVSQKALAERHGVSYAALCRRAAVEGWAKARKQARGAGERENGRAAQAAGDEAGDTELLARLRHKLLKRMDHIADAIPTGAVTESKTQDDEGVKLFKLRDLTAAYKDLAGDLSKGEDVEIEDLGPLEELLKE